MTIFAMSINKVAQFLRACPETSVNYELLKMSTRNARAAVAAQTLEILRLGKYQLGATEIDIAQALADSCQQTVLYRPDALAQLLATLAPPIACDTRITVLNTTTFAAARQLIAEGFEDVFCLNFASAKNPGGGFIAGSQAQEECLARASWLYASLLTQPDYYDANRALRSSLYTHHAIYSPKVPVFRNDKDALLPAFYQVSILTSPAVNAGAIKQNEPHRVAQIETEMRHRIHTVLAVARKHQHRALVLGAWGCGVFANDPPQVARWFREALEHPTFHHAFERVVFAVLDRAAAAPSFSAFEAAWA
jgi:uncharacterized protein (TIGR02452 family)